MDSLMDMDRPSEPDQDHRGALALALGILSLVLAFVAPIIGVVVGATAWSMASAQLAGMRDVGAHSARRRITSWGLRSGIVGTSLSLGVMLLSGLSLMYYATKSPQVIEDPVTITIADPR
jgi:hypothetical protein